MKESRTVKFEGAEARKRREDTHMKSSNEVTQPPVLKQVRLSGFVTATQTSPQIDLEQAVKREHKENPAESDNVTGVIKTGNPVFYSQRSI